MFFTAVLTTTLILFPKSGYARTEILPEYGKDIILFPAQDGSNSLIPAFLSNRIIKGIPPKLFPNEKDVHFYLYTPMNRDYPTELFINGMYTLQASNFIPNGELKILCHGFASSFINPFPANTKNKYLDTYGSSSINVIVMDWSLLALAPFYFSAVEHIPMVGNQIGKLITFLIESQYMTLDKVHFIGHSLGAHIGGIAARYVTNKIGGKLSRVTGLDPASPLVEDTPESISATVANFVDIIHTDGKFLGIAFPLGVADFYPNGGLEQTGCIGELLGECSHTRSHEYFLESIIPPSKNNSMFRACFCNNCKVREYKKLCYQEKFQLGKCDCGPATYMGEAVQDTARGLYFLDTNAAFPFSKS